MAVIMPGSVAHHDGELFSSPMAEPPREMASE
jgi:hypothetical protein